VRSHIIEFGERESDKMATMYDVLKAVQTDLEARDLLNKKEWNVICAMNVTTSRRQASHFWEILCTMKVLVPINGTTWRVNHDSFYDAMTKVNPATDGVPMEGGA